jgi:predicted nucleic acid-binding protein
VPLHYVDTSALVKLVIAEAETPQLLRWLRAEERVLVTCDLTRTELLRAVARAAPARMTRARDVLAGLTVVGLSATDFDAAGRLAPAELRSLDAIHLTVALALADDLVSVLAYDGRMARSARALGLHVDAPGAELPAA